MARQPFSPQRVGEAPTGTPFPGTGGGTPASYTPYSFSGPAPTAGGIDTDEQLRQQTLDQARNDGFESGLIEGRKQAAAESEALLAKLRESVEQVVRLRGELFESYRQEMVELALGVAQALVQREVADGRDVSRSLIEQAIEELGVDEPMHVTMSVEDAEQLRPWLETLSSGGASIQIQTDPALSPADIRVRTESGSVESLLEDRLVRARALVLGSNGAKEAAR